MGLEQGLAALKSQHGLQQQGLLSQLSMQPSFENNYFARQPGFAEQAGQGIAGGLGSILPLLGLLLGSTGGAVAGSAGGNGLQSLLSMLIGQGQHQNIFQKQNQSNGLTNQAYMPQPLNFGGQ